jgi:hypothetical protein
MNECPQCLCWVDQASHSCRYCPSKVLDVMVGQCHSPTCKKTLPHMPKGEYCDDQPRPVIHALGICGCDYITAAVFAAECPCCHAPEGQKCISSMDDIIKAKETMEQRLISIGRADIILRCRSGAHFFGSCCCTGNI